MLFIRTELKESTLVNIDQITDESIICGSVSCIIFLFSRIEEREFPCLIASLNVVSVFWNVLVGLFKNYLQLTKIFAPLVSKESWKLLPEVHMPAWVVSGRTGSPTTTSLNQFYLAKGVVLLPVRFCEVHPEVELFTS